MCLWSSLDRLDTEKATPLRFISQATIERALHVLFGEVDVDRFGVSGHDELETNRLALVHSQQQLSYALIGQHGDPAHVRAAA